MHLRVLQCRWLAIGTDEMSFRNEQARPCAGFPLQRLLELPRGVIKLDCNRRLQCRLRRNCWWSDKATIELDGAPPNRQAGNEKEARGGHEHRTIVIRLKPTDSLRHVQRTEPRITQISRISHDEKVCLSFRAEQSAVEKSLDV